MSYPSIAIRLDLIQEIKDNFDIYSDRRKKALREIRRDMMADREHFQRITIGGNKWIIYTSSNGTAWAEYIADRLGPRCRIVGCWLKNGLQTGLYYDEDDVLQGTPTYPIHAKFKDAAPKRYDKDNIEIPIIDDQDALSRMHVTLGQDPRLLV